MTIAAGALLLFWCLVASTYPYSSADRVEPPTQARQVHSNAWARSTFTAVPGHRTPGGRRGLVILWNYEAVNAIDAVSEEERLGQGRPWRRRLRGANREKMKGGTIAALRLRTPEGHGHDFRKWFDQLPGEEARFQRKNLVASGGWASSRDGRRAAITREGGDGDGYGPSCHSHCTCDYVETGKMPGFTSENGASAGRRHATGCKGPFRRLLVMIGILSLTCHRASDSSNGILRMTFTTAAISDTVDGGALEAGPDVSSHANVQAREATAESGSLPHLEERNVSLVLDKEQRRSALLALAKHQEIWPTYVHGKSKRGSVVVYRPLPPEAVGQFYNPKSSLLIDALLLEHLLQTAPADSSLLLVVDLQHVADQVRASLAPTQLAALHKHSSLMEFVKSPQWHMISARFFTRTLCEGIILINAPAIVQQVQPILEYLLFFYRSGMSPTRGNTRGREGTLLQVSQDDQALREAVDASQLPLEYVITTEVRAGAVREASSPRKDSLQRKKGAVGGGGHVLSSTIKLGSAPEHLALSTALSAALVGLGVNEPQSPERALEPPTVTSAASRAHQPRRRDHRRAFERKPVTLSKVGPPKPIFASDKHGRDRARFAEVSRERRVRETLMKVPEADAPVNRGRSRGSAVLRSEASATAVRGDAPHANLEVDSQELCAPAHSLRYGPSGSASNVAQIQGGQRARPRSVPRSGPDSHADWSEGEATTNDNKVSTAQRHPTGQHAGRGTKRSRRQQPSTDPADKGGRRSLRPSKRPGNLHRGGPSEQTRATQRQDLIALSHEESRYQRLRRAVRERFIATFSRKRAHGAHNGTRPPSGRAAGERLPHVNQPRQPDSPVQEHAIQEVAKERPSLRLLEKVETSSEAPADTGGVNETGAPARRDPLPGGSASDVSDKKCTAGGTGESSRRSYPSSAVDHRTILPKARNSRLTPPSSNTSETTGGKKQAVGRQESSEYSSRLLEASWTDETVDGAERSTNNPASASRAPRRMRQLRQFYSVEESGLSRTSRRTMSQPCRSFFLSEKEAAEAEDFDDVN